MRMCEYCVATRAIECGKSAVSCYVGKLMIHLRFHFIRLFQANAFKPQMKIHRHLYAMGKC